MRTLIKNIDIVTRNEVLKNSMCVIEDGKIVSMGKNEACDEVIDGEGGYLMPGFIDLHCHGGGGFDFMDASANEMKVIADYHLAHGTTTMLATTLADTAEATENSMRIFEEYKALYEESPLVGLHLEGPWFSPEQCGAQPTEFFRNPDAKELEGIKERHPLVLRVSAAPELDGELDFDTHIEIFRMFRTDGSHCYDGFSDDYYEGHLAITGNRWSSQITPLFVQCMVDEIFTLRAVEKLKSLQKTELFI